MKNAALSDGLGPFEGGLPSRAVSPFPVCVTADSGELKMWETIKQYIHNEIPTLSISQYDFGIKKIKCVHTTKLDTDEEKDLVIDIVKSSRFKKIYQLWNMHTKNK